MTIKNNLWRKAYIIVDCEVVGFNRLHDLTPDQYGKKNYCLSVLINRSLAKSIITEVQTEERKAEKEFGCEVRSFKRITNEADGRLCPPDKMVLNLSTDSKHGLYQLGIFDEDNKPITEAFKTIKEGSHIGIHFDLAMYKTNSVGASLKLKDIKINKSDLEITNKINSVSLFPNIAFSEDNFINKSEFETYIDEEI